MTLKCSRCSSLVVRRSMRHGPLETLLKLALIYPYRCKNCNDRFFRFWKVCDKAEIRRRRVHDCRHKFERAEIKLNFYSVSRNRSCVPYSVREPKSNCTSYIAKSSCPLSLGITAFDINARSAGPITADERRLMVQALLADRFKLVARKEKREVTVLALSSIEVAASSALI